MCKVGRRKPFIKRFIRIVINCHSQVSAGLMTKPLAPTFTLKNLFAQKKMIWLGPAKSLPVTSFKGELHVFYVPLIYSYLVFVQCGDPPPTNKVFQAPRRLNPALVIVLVG